MREKSAKEWEECACSDFTLCLSLPEPSCAPCRRLSNSMPKPQARDGLKLHLIARHVREHWVLALLIPPPSSPLLLSFYNWQTHPKGDRRTGGDHVYHRHGLWLATHLGSKHASPFPSPSLSLSPSVVACGPCNWLEPVAHQLFGCGLCDFYDEAPGPRRVEFVLITLPEAELRLHFSSV